MATFPFTHTPFFSDKNRAFWLLQSLGWGGVLAYRAVTGIANGQEISFLVPVIINNITGYSISLVLAVIYHNLINRKPLVTWGLTLLTLLVFVAIYAFIDAWVATLYRPNSENSFTAVFFVAVYIDITLIGAWSSLYYAINFFLRIEEQQDQLLRLENQATSAQLAMLRYQLNPHFLFNALNSISTLVLLKQTESANAMLSRLSSFLRYTLANEPTARVTLSQEIETLKLYLDIEKMRFEERLRTRFTIDPLTQNALLPSMLLQPLVENAIKYAVTPKEDGADIDISAQRVGDKMRITVSDTGPGTVPDKSPENNSTGVGLVNIRDRLQQAYNENHHFESWSPPSGGFVVIIEIPFDQKREDRY